MSSALRVVAPTRDELAQDIRQHLPAMYLFHDCSEWLPMEVFGRTQWLPPYRKGLPMIPHPVLKTVDQATGREVPLMVQANGRLAVRDTYGIRRDPRSNKALSVGLLDGQNAGDIVIFAVDTYGERGVVWLRGDDSDAERMDMSRKLYSRFIRSWAEQERGARAEAVRKFFENKANTGRIPPPPTKNQKRAQELLDNQDIRERSSAYICVIGYDWEGDDFETYARHMKAAHNKIVTQQDETVDPDTPGHTLSPEELNALEGGEQDSTIHGVGQPIIPEQLSAVAATVREHRMVNAGVDPRAAEMEGARPVGAAPPEPVVTGAAADGAAKPPRVTPQAAAAKLKGGKK